jgi:hypothetical protein
MKAAMSAAWLAVPNRSPLSGYAPVPKYLGVEAMKRCLAAIISRIGSHARLSETEPCTNTIGLSRTTNSRFSAPAIWR